VEAQTPGDFTSLQSIPERWCLRSERRFLNQLENSKSGTIEMLISIMARARTSTSLTSSWTRFVFGLTKSIPRPVVESVFQIENRPDRRKGGSGKRGAA
jgi:hypothetical protein